MDREAGIGESGDVGACTTQHPIPQRPSSPQQQVWTGDEVVTDASALETSGRENPLQIMPIIKQATISDRIRRGQVLLDIPKRIALDSHGGKISFAILRFAFATRDLTDAGPEIDPCWFGRKAMLAVAMGRLS